MRYASWAPHCWAILQNWQDKAPKRSQKERPIMKYRLRVQDILMMPSLWAAALETERRCFSKVILASNVTPNITSCSAQFHLDSMGLTEDELCAITNLESRVWRLSSIVEETLTSDKYVSLFLISILNMYILNFNIYVPIGVFFKDKCTNCQPEKITQVKRTNAPFLLLFLKWKH